MKGVFIGAPVAVQRNSDSTPPLGYAGNADETPDGVRMSKTSKDQKFIRGDGYTKRDGTKVKPHVRSTPDPYQHKADQDNK